MAADHAQTVRDGFDAAFALVSHADYDAFGELLGVVDESAGEALTAVHSWRPDYVDALEARVTSAGAHLFTHNAPLSTAAAIARLLTFRAIRP